VKKAMIAGAMLLLAGCSSTIDTTYYQLPAGSNPVRVSSNISGAQPMLWVEHVNVPDYLAGNGLVYQTSDVKYVIATNNLWASPLDQQLQQTLVTNLGRALPGRVVALSPHGEGYDTLNVSVTGFQGRYDGQVVVSGEWLLQHHDRLIKRSFSLTIPQTEDGYDAMVRTLATGWQQTAQQIAEGVAAQN